MLIRSTIYSDCSRIYGLFAVSAADRSDPDNSLEIGPTSTNQEEQFQEEVTIRFQRAWEAHTSDRLVNHTDRKEQIDTEMLRLTGFELFLEGLELDDTMMSLSIPEKDNIVNSLLDRHLFSLAKVPHDALKEIYSRIVDVKLPTLYILNSLHSDSASMDPFGTMQTKESFATYCRCMLQLLCFTARIHIDENTIKRICTLTERARKG